MGEEACGEAGPDVSSSSRPGAHLQSFELTGGIPLSLHVSVYFVPLNPQPRDNELLDCLPLFFLSCFPSVCHEPFPPQTHKQAGLVATPEGVGPFVLRKFKGKIKVSL